MESKDDIKNTEKYLDDILLYKALIDQGVQVMKKYKRYEKKYSTTTFINNNNSSITTETSTKKAFKETLVNLSPGESLGTGDGTTSLPPPLRKRQSTVSENGTTTTTTTTKKNCSHQKV